MFSRRRMESASLRISAARSSMRHRILIRAFQALPPTSVLMKYNSPMLSLLQIWKAVPSAQQFSMDDFATV